MRARSSVPELLIFDSGGCSDFMVMKSSLGPNDEVMTLTPKI